MIPIKDAVTNAMVFANDVLGPERAREMRLEEVELTQSGSKEVWDITLSMLKPDSRLDAIIGGLRKADPVSRTQTLFEPERPREYKTFAVDAASGHVLSMKIRELAHAE